MRGGRTGTLGTFGGVFTPSVLTILGVVLFLRTGFVVGEAGLVQALAILGLAKAISLLTSLSLAAIATNRKVRGGGDYYLISRSLGIEWGGALGLLLFAAQAVSGCIPPGITDPATAVCTVEDVVGATATSLPRCGGTPCWKIDADTACSSGQRLVIDRGGALPPAGSEVRASCERN